MSTHTLSRRLAAAFLVRLIPLTLAFVGACGPGGPEEPHVTEALSSAPDPAIDESIWMALAGVPQRELREAREAVRDHELKRASAELRRAGAFLRLEATHSIGEHVHARLVGAGIELEELSRQVLEGTVSARELDEVEARSLLAVAEHHQELARAALEEQKAALGGVNLEEGARGLEQAYEQAHLTLPASSLENLRRAQALGDELQADGAQANMRAAEETLLPLREDSERLENALGARRR